MSAPAWAALAATLVVAAGALAPRITGVAASFDTDRTLASATAWFAGFRIEARP